MLYFQCINALINTEGNITDLGKLKQFFLVFKEVSSGIA
jgi:hypothetical protein